MVIGVVVNSRGMDTFVEWIESTKKRGGQNV